MVFLVEPYSSFFQRQIFAMKGPYTLERHADHRECPGRDRMQIAHRFIGGVTEDRIVLVPEGRSPHRQEDDRECPSGTRPIGLPHAHQ
jgi:hypothetical protein